MSAAVLIGVLAMDMTRTVLLYCAPMIFNGALDDRGAGDVGGGDAEQALRGTSASIGSPRRRRDQVDRAEARLVIALVSAM